MKFARCAGAALILVIISQLGFAQESFKRAPHSFSNRNRTAAKTTVAAVAEEQYDIKYVKLNLHLSNASTQISGDVITQARVVASSMPAYVFELSDTLTIDSVLIDGVSRPLTTTAPFLRSVSLAAPLVAGTSFTAQVFYHGTTITGSGPFAGTNGLNSMVSPSWGTRATFSLSESYHAREWWPCKQSLRDKIDSSDVWITVPDSLKAGSNGLLQAVTPIDATHVRYEWKERYPIDHYLISVAVAPYVDYSYYMHFTGSTDSMLVQNYVYNNPATLTTFKPIIDSTGYMIDYFSTLYGRYPFWQEKYGHCMARLSGGMEHQTMTTLGFFEATLVAHELGHQWFGDNVTCATWADIVMNEGFAAYTEYLFLDHFYSHFAATNDIKDRHDNVKSSDGGSVFVDDTTSEGRIFDSRLTYDKGACVLHMLRFIVNNDTSFFNIYKTWQSQMKDSTGSIAEFKNITKAVLGATVVNGINLDTFFQQWMYAEGFPIHDFSWNQVGDDVYLQLDQTTSVPSSVAYFSIPMEITLHSPLGDTLVRIINDEPTQLYHFSWSKHMTGIYVDPFSWLVDSVQGINHSLSLGVSGPQAALVRIAPNPASAAWNVANLQEGSILTLTDVSGRGLWSTMTSGSAQVIPAANLAPGLYLLSVRTPGGAVSSFKLARQ